MSYDHGGDTALHFCAINTNRRGRQRCLELLVEAGANPGVRNLDKLTAVQKARAWRRDGGEELAALLAARKKRR